MRILASSIILSVILFSSTGWASEAPVDCTKSRTELVKIPGGYQSVYRPGCAPVEPQVPFDEKQRHLTAAGGLGVHGANVDTRAASPVTPGLAGAAAKSACAENGSCYGDLSMRTGLPKTVHVNGHYRANGTYVQGHYRSNSRGRNR